MSDKLRWYLCWAAGIILWAAGYGAWNWSGPVLILALFCASIAAAIWEAAARRRRSKQLAGHDAPGDFGRMAPSWRDWQQLNPIYHEEVRRAIAFGVPEGKRILDLGCAWGDLLAQLKPGRGVGVDIEAAQVECARREHPEFEFVTADACKFETDEKFDFVVCTDLINQVEDVQELFERARAALAPLGQVVVAWHNSAWEWLLKSAERLGLKTPSRNVHWISSVDVANLLELAGLEVVHMESRCLCPLRIPFVAWLSNRVLVRLPILRHFGFAHVAVARPAALRHPEASVTVLIPCRNERGNIAPALQRLPKFGREQEIIFVEGNSTDGTWDEILKQKELHPEMNIVAMQQPGKGKGDAVRAGYAVATGDILMILDADLTVRPEELPRFYDALITGKADFVNGTRLVYPMQEEAMRFLNLLGNKAFSVLFSWLLGQPIRDTLCGTKVLWRERYLDIAANRSYFGDFDPFGDFDLLFGAAKLRLKIMNLPVHYMERTYGSTNISRFRNGFTLLRMFILGTWKLKTY